MGLTKNSTGLGANENNLFIRKSNDNDKIIALAGNPNVGKSTLFNEMTGMHQHTGNWPGKTVCNARGIFKTDKHNYIMVDIPGTYSLTAHSAEEEVARNFLCFQNPDAVIVVCDATCLERNLNLVLQTMEICKNVIVCINLMDEAKRKGIKIDLKTISARLGVPVIGTVAREKSSIKKLAVVMDNLTDGKCSVLPYAVSYSKEIEEAISEIEPVIKEKIKNTISSRWLSLKLLDKDDTLNTEIKKYVGEDFFEDKDINNALSSAEKILKKHNINAVKLKDLTVNSIIKSAEEITKDAVFTESKYNNTDRKIDKILTSKITGFPVMIIMLMIIFYLTITFANYPSKVISDFLFGFEDKIKFILNIFNVPENILNMLVYGVYRVLAWVVSVMLPPMAIFFPLFTLLEDIGYLPRVAYNLDKPFKHCSACGKQALTMCMGFGCNAAGVVGCRIIDSQRERLLAILTNSLVPCNGRFPSLISIITMFFAGVGSGIFSSVKSSLILTCVIIFSILMTFFVTKILSVTLLKGVPSSFTLEMPPYRKPQILKVILRSIFDRTLFVLARAVVVAAPAGAVIWLSANLYVGDITVLTYFANILDPFAKLMGLDGVILIAFILGIPANEIVIPIIIMAYMSCGNITELNNLLEMKKIFVENGWTYVTAVNVILFSLMHWPCSTTLMTVKKETGSIKWTVLSAVIPTLLDIICCMIFNFISKII